MPRSSTPPLFILTVTRKFSVELKSLIFILLVVELYEIDCDEGEDSERPVDEETTRDPNKPTRRNFVDRYCLLPVSYTHLTLPTKRIV